MLSKRFLHLENIQSQDTVAFNDHASFPQYSQRALNVDLSTRFFQTCVNLTVCRADNEGYMLDPMPPVIV